MKKRYAMVINLNTDKINEYKKLHAAVWPEVIDVLHRHHIKNYSIYLKDNLLFAYLEYHGEDYTADMQRIAAYEVTQRWWKLTDPCQQPLPSRQSGEWWASMEEVFHLD